MSRRPAVTGGEGEWQLETMPVREYLGALGASADPGPPTEELLTWLHRRHLETFAFEAVDPFLGRVPSLGYADVCRKISSENRAGYCFEQNTLFAAVLENLGFGVRRLGGRMRLGSPRPRGKHMALVAEAGGQRWLVDVGFGADGLIEPIPWRDGAEVVQDGWAFRFDQAAPDDWVLSALLPGIGWFDLYSVSEAVQHRIDFEITNYFIGHHPRSPFTGHLVAQYRADGDKILLRDTTLTELGADGSRRETPVAPDEVAALLSERFRMRLRPPTADALAAKLGGEGDAALARVSDESWAQDMESRDPAEAREPAHD